MVRQVNAGINETTDNESFIQTNETIEDTAQCGQSEDEGPTKFGYEGEFLWDRKMVGLILSSYFYSYVLIQVPSGWLSTKFGGKYVFGVGMLVAGVATLLIPVCTRLHVGLLIALRLVIGVGTGVTFPTAQSLMGCWLPPAERGRLFGISLAGSMLGSVLALSITGQFCAVTLDKGWPFAFYLFGGLTVLWWFWWQYAVYSTPEQHPRISREEKHYIMTSLGRSEHNTQKDLSVPWCAVLTSPAVWAIIVVHITASFNGYTIMTTIPLYMQDVLRFNVKQNGFLSALPLLLQVMVTFVLGALSDHLITQKILSTGTTRKIMQAMAQIGPIVGLLILSYLDCEQRTPAVVLLCFTVACMAGTKTGYQLNPADLSPRFAGIVYGISNTIANCTGFLVPVIVGMLTPNGTREEWQKIFFICAGLSSLGLVVFTIFAKGEEQEWSKTASPVVVRIVRDEDEKDPEAKRSFL